MKLTIDTKEDSHEEIRKVIKMLQHLVGESSYSNYNNESSSRNIFDDPSPSLSSSESSYGSNNSQEESAAPTNAFSAMFGDGAPATRLSCDIGIHKFAPNGQVRIMTDGISCLFDLSTAGNDLTNSANLLRT